MQWIGNPAQSLRERTERLNYGGFVKS